MAAGVLLVPTQTLDRHLAFRERKERYIIFNTIFESLSITKYIFPYAMVIKRLKQILHCYLKTLYFCD